MMVFESLQYSGQRGLCLKAKNNPEEARLHMCPAGDICRTQDNTRHVLVTAGLANMISGGPALYIGLPTSIDSGKQSRHHT